MACVAVSDRAERESMSAKRMKKSVLPKQLHLSKARLDDLIDDAWMSEYNNQLDVESAPVQDLIRYLVGHHVAITSTLAAYEEGLGMMLEEDKDKTRHAVTWQAWELSRMKIAAVRHLHLDRLLGKEMAFEHDFVKAGGTLLAGSDPTGQGEEACHFMQHRYRKRSRTNSWITDAARQQFFTEPQWI